MQRGLTRRPRSPGNFIALVAAVADRIGEETHARSLCKTISTFMAVEVAPFAEALTACKHEARGNRSVRPDTLKPPDSREAAISEEFLTMPAHHNLLRSRRVRRLLTGAGLAAALAVTPAMGVQAAT